MRGGRVGLVVVALAATACLEAPPDAPPPPGDECTREGGRPRDPVGGNVVDFTFDDDPVVTELIHDRSGNQLHGALELGFIDGGGAHGFSVGALAGTDALVEVPPSSLLHLGTELTLETWVWRDEMGVDHGLISTWHPEREVSELVLEVIGDGVRFGVATGECSAPEMAYALLTPDRLTVESGTWIHLAVTWDGEEARFYRDGTLWATEPLAAEPCPLEGPLLLGATAPGVGHLAGWLDDVKLSNYIKSEAEIQDSRAHDPTADGDRCGDGVLDPGEQCEAPAPCCDPATCQYGGSFCCSGECAVGICVDGSRRTDDGLVALYELDEGEGTMAADSSGSGLHLDIAGIGYSWAAGSLTLSGDTYLVSSATADTVVAACQASQELTVEAWITPDNLSDENGTIAMLGLGDDCQGFALMQRQGWLTAALSTDITDPDGDPLLDTPPGGLEMALTHVVITRSADGRRRLYLDGRVVSESVVGGDFSSWQSSQRLTVGGPVTGVSPSCEAVEAGFWRGRIHRLALYDRALSPAEVGGNYAAGPD